MISWLADPSRANELAVWGFLIGTLGTAATLIGLGLTYAQARRARISTEELQREIETFDFKKDRSDALSLLGEAKAAMESTGRLVRAESWRDAVSSYDEARKLIQRVRLLCSDLNASSQKNLRLICDHLSAFANDVDGALVGKGSFPDATAVRATIRKNSDIMTAIQREIQEALK